MKAAEDIGDIEVRCYRTGSRDRLQTLGSLEWKNTPGQKKRTLTLTTRSLQFSSDLNF